MDRNIAIIPARGGSKRLKDKNIYPLKQKPLIAYSIEACKASSFIHEVYVSSDSDKILAVAEEHGAIPVKRPRNLADDNTPKIMAVREATRQIEKIDRGFQNVAIVQANSPELTAEMLDKGFAFFFQHGLWEVMSADSNGLQNAAFRIVKKEVAFQQFLSAHCGFVTCDVLDVHTLEDIKKLEQRL